MVKAPPPSSRKLTAEDIRRVCGAISDWKLKEILASGADLDALEQAVAWTSGNDETTPMRHIPPGSPAARIYEILLGSEEFDEPGDGSGA